MSMSLAYHICFIPNSSPRHEIPRVKNDFINARNHLPTSFNSKRQAILWKKKKESFPCQRRSISCPRSKISIDEIDKSTGDSVTASRERIKSLLIESLENGLGNIKAADLESIDELKRLNPTDNLLSCDLSVFQGNFRMLNSTMEGVLYRAASVSVGQLSFNKFQPSNLTKWII